MKSKTLVFVHGMYMNSLCWEHWVARFSAAGFKTLAPNWPGRDKQVEELGKNHPDPELAKLTLTRIVEHFTDIIKKLDEKPILIGHSMGGLVVQILLQKGLAHGGIAIDSAPPKGVFTSKWSFVKSNLPHITPFANQNIPIEMSFGRFQYTFVNGLPLDEQKSAYERYVVPESRRVPAESLSAKVDFKADRPPLLLIAGSKDHIIPASLNRTNFKKYAKSPAITNYKEFEGRTHFTIGQQGWEEVADYVLGWIKDKAQ